jgi:hypothetical protein
MPACCARLHHALACVSPPTGIAAADAIGMALCVLAFFHVSKLAKQFVYEVDKSTLEVADYTIIVKGLPEVNPIDVSV